LNDKAHHGYRIKGNVRDDARKESLRATKYQCEHHAKQRETDELQWFAVSECEETCAQ
jgi:hypothetical protein